MRVKFFDLVKHCRIQTGRNMWTDMLEMDLIYIITGWEDNYDT